MLFAAHEARAEVTPPVVQMRCTPRQLYRCGMRSADRARNSLGISRSVFGAFEVLVRLGLPHCEAASGCERHVCTQIGTDLPPTPGSERLGDKIGLGSSLGARGSGTKANHGGGVAPGRWPPFIASGLERLTFRTRPFSSALFILSIASAASSCASTRERGFATDRGASRCAREAAASIHAAGAPSPRTGRSRSHGAFVMRRPWAC